MGRPEKSGPPRKEIRTGVTGRVRGWGYPLASATARMDLATRSRRRTRRDLQSPPSDRDDAELQVEIDPRPRDRARRLSRCDHTREFYIIVRADNTS